MTNDLKGKLIYKKWLESEIKPDVIYFYKDKYYPIDGFVVIDDALYGFELKYRVNYSISDFDSIILEKKKFDEMVNFYKKFDNVSYVNIFNDGKMCSISIQRLLRKEIRWFECLLPKDEDKTLKVKKLIAKIPMEWCKIINYK